MNKITHVKALEKYRFDLTFGDGVHGVVDLSDLAGSGVFALWNDYAHFRQVRIGDTGELGWSDQVDLCPDSLYLRLTGKTPEDILQNLKHQPAHA